MELKISDNSFDIDYKNDSFFDSIRNDYEEFDQWYEKAINDPNKKGYYWIKNNKLEAFIGLKIEDEEINEGNILLEKKKRLKITTIKSNNNIKNFTEFVIFYAIYEAIEKQIEEIYFSIIKNNEEKEKLFEISKTYGFELIGNRKRKNQIENYLLKKINVYFKNKENNWKKYFPKINLENKNVILPIESKWHDEFLQTAKLKNKKNYFNPYKMGITKAYVHNMNDIFNLRKNDNLLIYRKAQKNKWYESAITGIGVVQEHFKKEINYSNLKEFEKILKDKQAFPNDSKNLNDWFNKNKYITFFTWNIAFGEENNINYKTLKEKGIWPEDKYPSNFVVDKIHVEKWIKKSKGEKWKQFYYRLIQNM